MAGKTVKQLYGNGSGQSFMDRVNAAKHSFTGSGLAKVVCKATTEEMAAPKKKHLEYLVQCTFEHNVSIPELANLLIERTQQTNWVVVFKSLITIHHLMNFGNERFFQYLASNNSQLSLSTFTDRTGMQAFDMSKFVRQYSRYVEQKSRSYRDMAFDFCKIKRGKEEGVMRKMSAEKLMKTIPILETQLDSMLDFDITVVANGSEIHHAIVYAAFLLLYKDAIRLFATYNDGIINLIEKYFTMSRKQCKEALDCYKKFTKRMDRLNKFLRLAEEIGFGEQNGLELQPVPPAVLEALENHLHMLEGKKPHEISNSTLSTSGSSSTTAASGAANNMYNNHDNDQSAGSFCLSDADKRKIIEEEKAKLEEYASKRSQNAAKAFNAMTESAAHKLMLSSTSNQLPAPNCNNFQGNSNSGINRNRQQTQTGSNSTINNSTKTSDDLVLLDLDPNPTKQQQQATTFISPEVADIFGVNTSGMVVVSTSVPSSTTTAPPTSYFGPTGQFVPPSQNFMMNQAPTTNTSSEINFDRAFANEDKRQVITTPAYKSSATNGNTITAATNNGSVGNKMSLDDKLASLVGNLDISPAAKIQSQIVTSVNWGNNVASSNNVSGKSMFEAKPNPTPMYPVSSSNWSNSTSTNPHANNTTNIMFQQPTSGISNFNSTSNMLPHQQNPQMAQIPNQSFPQFHMMASANNQGYPMTNTPYYPNSNMKNHQMSALPTSSFQTAPNNFYHQQQHQP